MEFNLQKHGAHIIGLYYAVGMVLTGYFYSEEVIGAYTSTFIVASLILCLKSTDTFTLLMQHIKNQNGVFLVGIVLSGFVGLHLNDSSGAACLLGVFATPTLLRIVTMWHQSSMA